MIRIYHTLFFIFCINVAFAQQQYMSPCGNVIAGDDCADAGAPSICELDGFLTNSGGLTTDLGCILDGNFCGINSVAHNNMWIAFQIAPGERDVTFEINMEDCNSGNGIQASIIALDDCSCQGDLTPISCINCITNDFELSAFNLQENTNYYIMIDGCMADACNFSINVIKGLPQINIDIANITSFPLCEDTADCSSTTTLSATASPGNPNSFVYDWYDENRKYVASGRFIEVMGCSGDDFFVKARRASDCCPVEGMTTLSLATPDQRATAILNSPDSLSINCLGNSSITLDATGSSVSDHHVYGWAHPNGDLIEEQETVVTLTNPEPGTYTFITYHAMTFCLDEVEVEVSCGAVDIVVSASSIPLCESSADCSSPTTLFATASPGDPNDYTYRWYNEAGDEIGTVRNLGIEGCEGEEYTVAVSGQGLSAEQASTVLTLAAEDQRATAVLNMPNMLTTACNELTSITLDATGSSIGTNYAYSWVNPQGTPVQPGNVLISVSDPMEGIWTFGTYNLESGCLDQVEVSVICEVYTPPSCGEGIGTDNCSDAKVASLCELDGFTGSLANATADLNCIVDSVICGPNSVINNSVWIAFRADRNNVSLSIKPSNCVDGLGLQTAMFELSDCSCEATLTPLTCVNCVSSNFILSYENLIPNNTYYIVIDGCNDDVCDYEIEVIDGLAALETAITSIASTPLCENNMDCNNMTTLSATAGPEPANNYTYDWYNGAGNLIGSGRTLATEGCAGDEYTVKVSSADDCCSAYFVEATTVLGVVAEDERVEAVLNMSAEIELLCEDAKLILDATGSTIGDNYTYGWVSPSGAILVQNSLTYEVETVEEGIYTFLTFNNNTTCYSEVGVRVRIAEGVAIPPQFCTLNCVLSSCDITASLVEGNMAYQWQDSNGNIIGTTATMTLTEAGIYTIFISDLDMGCTFTEIVNIADDTAIPTLTISGNTILDCSRSSTDLTATSNVTNSTFDWSGPNGFMATTSSIAVNVPGVYSLVITNAESGCTSTDFVEVTQAIDIPVAVLSSSGVLTCNNSAVVLATTGSSEGSDYIYSFAGPCVNGDVVTCGGVYTLTVTNLSNNCSSTAAIQIVEDYTVPIVNAGMDQAIDCSTMSVTLGDMDAINSNYTYSWEYEGQVISLDPIVSVSEEGIYTLTATDNTNGCTDSDEVMVTLDAMPPSLSIPSEHEVGCGEETVDLIAVSDTDMIDWYFEGDLIASNTNSITVSEAGIYQLIAAGDNACTSSATTSVSISSGGDNAPDASAEVQTLQVSSTFTITYLEASSTTSGVTFEWTGPNNFYAFGAIAVISQSGTYTLTVTGPDGCSTTLSITANVLLTPTPDELAMAHELLKPTQALAIRVAPNPFSSNITLQMDHAIKDYTIKILNINGQVLFQTKTEKVLDLDHLPAGIYFLEVESAQNTAIERIIKQ